MANLWQRIKAYMSGWPIGKDDEPEPKKKPKGLNPKKKKSTKKKSPKKSTKPKVYKQGNMT